MNKSYITLHHFVICIVSQLNGDCHNKNDKWEYNLLIIMGALWQIMHIFYINQKCFYYQEENFYGLVEWSTQGEIFVLRW